MSVALMERALAAHGGRAAWEAIEEVRLTLTAGGLAFASKFRGRALRDVRATVSTKRQRTVFDAYPRIGMRGVFEEGRVRIETDTGTVIAKRDDARSAFRDLRHHLWWDNLDVLYFAGYALWTYVGVPFVFAQAGFETEELGRYRERGEIWERLLVRSPDSVHTHSREQVLYFDADGLLRRHDYTAEPFGTWAKAANHCSRYAVTNGIRIPSRRRVYPRRSSGRARRSPLLVWIELDDVSAV